MHFLPERDIKANKEMRKKNCWYFQQTCSLQQKQGYIHLLHKNKQVNVYYLSQINERNSFNLGDNVQWISSIQPQN
jgi:hypothetical protein